MNVTMATKMEIPKPAAEGNPFSLLFSQLWPCFSPIIITTELRTIKVRKAMRKRVIAVISSSLRLQRLELKVANAEITLSALLPKLNGPEELLELQEARKKADISTTMTSILFFMSMRE